MSDPFLGEIRLLGCNFPPQGWAQCNGQLLSIAQNTALFSILGTTYGGNGTSTFALPNLQGQVPMGAGAGPGLSVRSLGESGGEPSVAIGAAQMPAHTHEVGVSAAAATNTTASSSTAIGVAASKAFGPAYNLSPMGGVVGGSLPHNNLQPYLTLNFCIALQGVFPPRA